MGQSLGQEAYMKASRLLSFHASDVDREYLKKPRERTSRVTMLRRQLTIIVLTTVLAVILTGCTQATPGQDGDNSVPEQIDTTARARGLECTQGKEHWRSSNPPIRGGTWRATGGVPNLDPVSGSPNLVGVVAQIYNTLLEQRSCFFEDIEVAPGLATSWQVSPDGRVWTLKLDTKARWHNKPPVNGRPFTSADVAWTIDYHKKLAGVLKPYWEDIEYRTPDASTIVLSMKEPRADFLYQLSFPQNMMMPKEIHEQYGDFKTVAVGTGAFMMKEFKPNLLRIIERNPDYHKMGRDGKPLPYIDGLEAHAVGDRIASEAAFLAGQVDAGGPETKDEFERWKQLLPKATTGGGVRGTLHALWFNMSIKPWDDVRLRKALVSAISRDDIILGSRRGSFAHAGFFPGSFPEFVWSVDKQKEKFKYDPELAKKKLAEAGYAPGAIKVVMKTTGQYAQDAEVVQNHLKNVGIENTIQVDTPQAGGGGANIVLIKGDYDIMWGVPLPSTFIDYWAVSIIRSGSPFNIPRISDSELDAMSDAQSRELDPLKRKAILDKLQDRLYELMPYIPVQSTVTYALYACRVKNVVPQMPNAASLELLEVWFDPTGC